MFFLTFYNQYSQTTFVFCKPFFFVYILSYTWWYIENQFFRINYTYNSKTGKLCPKKPNNTSSYPPPRDNKQHLPITKTTNNNYPRYDNKQHYLSPWQQSTLKIIYYYNINNLNNDNIYSSYYLLY